MSISDNFIVSTVVSTTPCKNIGNMHKYVRYRDYKSFNVNRFLDNLKLSGLDNIQTNSYDIHSI